MRISLFAALAVLVSACATAPTDLSFQPADRTQAKTDFSVAGDADGKNAVLVLAIGSVATGGAYEFQQLNADQSAFNKKGNVTLGFGTWGWGDKMKRPEGDHSAGRVVRNEINFLIKNAEAGAYAATTVSWNTFNGYSSGSAWYCMDEGAAVFDIEPGKINLLSSNDVFPPRGATILPPSVTEAEVLAQFELTRQNYPDLKGEPVLIYPTRMVRWVEASVGIMRVCGVAKPSSVKVVEIEVPRGNVRPNADTAAAIKTSVVTAAPQFGEFADEESAE